MRQVTSYDLQIGLNHLDVIPGQVVHVASIREVGRMWVLHERGLAPEHWEVLVIGSGGDVPINAEYLGTTIDSSGALHAFRIT